MEQRTAAQTFYDNLDTCHVIYKAKNSTVATEDQRTTVAGVILSDDKGGKVFSIGVAIKSHKDTMDKKKAREVSGRRALFTPVTVIDVNPELSEEEVNKELHNTLRFIKEQYDELALVEDFIPVVSITE